MLVNHRVTLVYIIKVSHTTRIILLVCMFHWYYSTVTKTIYLQNWKVILEAGHPLKIFMSTETSDQNLEISRTIHAIYLTNDVIWFTNNDHAEKDIIISRKVFLHERLSPLCMVQLHRFVRDLLNWNAVSITSSILLNQQRICIICHFLKERIFVIDIFIDLQRQFFRL